MRSLPVSSLIRIEDPMQYTLHIARWNGQEQPLDIYANSRGEWPVGNRFPTDESSAPRNYVFSIIDFYPETDTWLFGGNFRVVAQDPAVNEFSCTTEEIPEYSGFVGRLKIHMPRPPRGLTFRLEKLLPSMEIAEVLPELFGGGGVNTR
jgi:hypothetical protein